MKKPIVVNLFGAPGAGKSTGAAYIFSELKQKGVLYMTNPQQTLSSMVKN